MALRLRYNGRSRWDLLTAFGPSAPRRPSAVPSSGGFHPKTPFSNYCCRLLLLFFAFYLEIWLYSISSAAKWQAKLSASPQIQHPAIEQVP